MTSSLIRCATLVQVTSILALSGSVASALSMSSGPLLDRRSAIATAISTPFLLLSDSASASASSPDTESPPSSSLAEAAVVDANGGSSSLAIASPNPRAITTIRINSPKQYAGLELYDVTIGTPPRNVVAVRSVRPDGQGSRAGAERGMILLDYVNAQDMVKRISSGVYPIEIRLYNLALGGDALGDLGRSIVSPEDALELAASVSSSDSNAVDGSKFSSSDGLKIDTVQKAKDECSIKSRRGDTMQINYEARIGDKSGAIYDASAWRGTGQPYAYVLGNHDVLSGVDLGTFDMCPGEIRELTIPPELGYRNGSKLYKQIPPNSKLFWRVELVELNFVKEGMNDKPREEDFY
eukprot:CAMPEP_0201919518 /NCGR_PEP_ID=MMETSP0903-20130614/8389_1 /ASSEMBLY_ACC=CAM_ASM_000552 /TAXON_ID=420261 /ORGANISM="Thalassiosira antarctica, Strain CCMP982" /LENGTH=351 /DNA_ID=CAMNT_0048456063 /DNA_START=24 /DNA_END=1079 /DNA_ORIENTATION=+